MIGPEQDVRWPAYSNVMDFELELACILGRTGVNIPRAEAAHYIFGFTIFGPGTLRSAREGFQHPWSMRQARRSPAYTTRWSQLPWVK